MKQESHADGPAKGATPPPPPPGEGWTQYQDSACDGITWWYYEGSLGTWCIGDGIEVQEYVEEKRSESHVATTLAQDAAAEEERKEGMAHERFPFSA